MMIYYLPDISQARPTVQASFMQRMADVLTTMMNRSSQRVSSPTMTSPVGSPSSSSEANFPAQAIPIPIPADRPEVIDCVSYESLWRSETQSDNQESSSGTANVDIARSINDPGRLETTFSSFGIRQESESNNLSCSIPRLKHFYSFML